MPSPSAISHGVPATKKHARRFDRRKNHVSAKRKEKEVVEESFFSTIDSSPPPSRSVSLAPECRPQASSPGVVLPPARSPRRARCSSRRCGFAPARGEQSTPPRCGRQRRLESPPWLSPPPLPLRIAQLRVLLRLLLSSRFQPREIKGFVGQPRETKRGGER